MRYNSYKTISIAKRYEIESEKYNEENEKINPLSFDERNFLSNITPQQLPAIKKDFKKTKK